MAKLFKDKVQRFTEITAQMRKKFKFSMAKTKEVKPVVKLGIKKPSMPKMKLPKPAKLKVYQLKMKK